MLRCPFTGGFLVAPFRAARETRWKSGSAARTIRAKWACASPRFLGSAMVSIDRFFFGWEGKPLLKSTKQKKVGALLPTSLIWRTFL